MRTYYILFFAVSLLLLVGCQDTWSELKEAASGINDQADKAATGISQDVHTLRATEIHYDEQSFTVNDLVKTILRDIQWFYEESGEKTILQPVGTWKSPLFEDELPSTINRTTLAENGKVTLSLAVQDGQLVEDQTLLTIQQDGEILIEKSGLEALTHCYEIYVQMMAK